MNERSIGNLQEWCGRGVSALCRTQVNRDHAFVVSVEHEFKLLFTFLCFLVSDGNQFDRFLADTCVVLQSHDLLGASLYFQVVIRDFCFLPTSWLFSRPPFPASLF